MTVLRGNWLVRMGFFVRVGVENPCILTDIAAGVSLCFRRKAFSACPMEGIGGHKLGIIAGAAWRTLRGGAADTGQALPPIRLA